MAGCSLAVPRDGAPGAAVTRASEPTPPPECGKYGACSVVACFGTICIAYATDGSVQAELLSGIAYAQGIAADARGELYIADSGKAAVFKYAPLFKSLLATYEDYDQVPLDVAVDAKRNLLAVSNASTTSGGGGSVSVYAHGSLTPTATLEDPKAPGAQGFAIAIDGKGDCFWSLHDPSSGLSRIDEFAGCAGSPRKIVSGTDSLAGMALDKTNDLFYVDDTARAIFRCKGTAHCSVLAMYFSKPLIVNFDRQGRFIWLDDVGVLEGPLIESLDPKSGAVVSSFRAGSTTDPPFGVAHAPGPPR